MSDSKPGAAQFSTDEPEAPKSSLRVGAPRVVPGGPQVALRALPPRYQVLPEEIISRYRLGHSKRRTQKDLHVSFKTIRSATPSGNEVLQKCYGTGPLCISKLNAEQQAELKQPLVAQRVTDKFLDVTLECVTLELMAQEVAHRDCTIGVERWRDFRKALATPAHVGQEAVAVDPII